MLEELNAAIEPLLRKHPEAVTVMEVLELQRVCRYSMRWCEELVEWNQRTEKSLQDANMMLEAILPDG
jgi:hypothetical protein